MRAWILPAASPSLRETRARLPSTPIWDPNIRVSCTVLKQMRNKRTVCPFFLKLPRGQPPLVAEPNTSVRLLSDFGQGAENESHLSLPRIIESASLYRIQVTQAPSYTSSPSQPERGPKRVCDTKVGTRNPFSGLTPTTIHSLDQQQTGRTLA